MVFENELIGDSLFQLPMVDDGHHADGAAGHGVFGVSFAAPPAGKSIRYWVEALDAVGQGTREPYGSQERTLITSTAGPRLLINEFMAKNGTTILDAGAPDDWVEAFIAEAETLHLAAFTLTDNLANPTKWRFPAMELAPGDRVLVWADEEAAQGPLHANFKLDKDGEGLGIFFTGGGVPVPCDTIVFGLQATDISTGRIPDGGTWQSISTPTPAQSNAVTGIDNGSMEIPYGFGFEPAYPNPFNPATQIGYSVIERAWVRLSVLDLHGREVAILVDAVQRSGRHRATWNAEGMRSGTYFVVLTSGGQRAVQRIVLIR